MVVAERAPTRNRNSARKTFPPLGREFEPFLYAVLYEDGHGMPLTTVSAIARSGVDPWKEAARIAQMPKPLAFDTLAGLAPERGDAADIAGRLFALLPPTRKNKIAPAVVVQEKPHWSPLVPAILILLLILTLVAVFRRTPHADAGAFEGPATPIAEKADP